jgi:CHAT domain-containing protein
VDYFDPFSQSWGESYYCALVCKRDSDFPRFVSLGMVNEVYEIMTQSDPSENSSYVKSIPVNRALYEKIWHPIEQHLNGAKRVYVCPEGKLNQLAFHALYATDRGDTLLGQKYDIRYRLSPSGILRKPIAMPEKSIALMGGALFDSLPPLVINDDFIASRGAEEKDTTRGRRFVYLKNTKTEAEKIGSQFHQKKWKVAVMTGHDASEQNFRQLCNNGCPGVIHLATHGSYFAGQEPKHDPPYTLEERIYSSDAPLMRSLVALSGANISLKSTDAISVESDGILTALEISNLDLSGVDLVVLSACETARGDVLAQEGVFGLQRAFRLAGVRSLLVSLWKVPDKQTMELMDAFYRYYLDGNTSADALRMAQTELSKKYAPYYWAAFILVE